MIDCIATHHGFDDEIYDVFRGFEKRVEETQEFWWSSCKVRQDLDDLGLGFRTWL